MPSYALTAPQSTPRYRSGIAPPRPAPELPRRALAEDDHAENFILGDVGDARRADDASVLHHANPIGQIEDVMNVMADQENADAVGLELADEFADLRRLLRSERRRRFVHDQNIAR